MTMTRLLFDARDTDRPHHDPIEPVMTWEDLVKAAEIRQAFRKLREDRNARDSNVKDA